jgi:ribA/ribD-fused uncharacterized protein
LRASKESDSDAIKRLYALVDELAAEFGESDAVPRLLTAKPWFVFTQMLSDCPDFLFFSGHRPSGDGGIRPGCLSHWWPAPLTVDGVTYPTTEHFMMAGKARLFGNEVMASRILEAPSPRDAKALGRDVRGYEEECWAASRYGIVVEGNSAKFAQNPVLLTYLAATAGRVLVEASPADRVWASAWRRRQPGRPPIAVGGAEPSRLCPHGREGATGQGDTSV